MSEKKERIVRAVRRYGIAGAVGLGIAVLVALRQGFDMKNPAYLNARYCSDGCFVACVVFLGLGSLVWVSTTGFFDIFRYAFHSLLVLFTPLKKPEEHENYYEYKAERDAARGKPSWFLLIVGAALLALSVIGLALYYKLPQ